MPALSLTPVRVQQFSVCVCVCDSCSDTTETNIIRKYTYTHACSTPHLTHYKAIIMHSQWANYC